MLHFIVCKAQFDTFIDYFLTFIGRFLSPKSINFSEFFVYVIESQLAGKKNKKGGRGFYYVTELL